MIKNKIRNANYERLQKEYENVPESKKPEINRNIEMYRSGHINYINTVRKLNNKFLSTDNTQADKVKYYKEIIKHMSKTPIQQKKQKQRINENMKVRNERFNDCFKTNKKRNIIKDIEEINSNNAFSTIKINLNTNQAYPKMPPDQPGKGLSLIHI